MDLWAGFRAAGWKAPKCDVQLDAKAVDELGRDVATAVATQIQENLRSGRRPDGRLLPPPASATLERRAYRVAQSARGGEASPRIKDPVIRARVKQRWNERFPIGGVGAFSKTAGVESGRLAASVQAVKGAQHWGISVAQDRVGGDRDGSPLARVLHGGPVFSADILRGRHVRAAFEKIVKELFKTR